MILEILEDMSGYLYKKEIETFVNCPVTYKTLSTEYINGMSITRVQVLDYQHDPNKQVKNGCVVYKCTHGKRLDYVSINLLPSENWHELIEFWSCHSNEFATVKQLPVIVRPHGILISSFFLLINDIDLPSCCSHSTDSVRKIWYNEMCGMNHDKLVYDYLKSYFQTDDCFILMYKDLVYEVKLFYFCECLLVDDNVFNKCMKVGIRKKDSIKVSTEHLNEFYMGYIYDHVLTLDIYILGYKIGYIYYQKKL